MHSPLHRATKRLTGFAAILGSCVGLLVAGNLQAADVPTIAAKLLERQRSVRTARFTWREHKTYPKHSLNDGEGHIVPPKEETIERINHLMLDSTIGSGRYEIDGKEWSFIEMRFVPQHHEIVVSGEVMKMFTASGTAKHGTIDKLPTGQWSNWLPSEAKPFLLSFRAQDPVIGNFEPAKWAVDSVGKDAEGRMTVVISTKPRADSKQLLTFLDDGNFPLLRIEHQSKGKTTFLMDIKNVADEKVGWVPETWKASRFNRDGTAGTSTSAKMISYEINPKIPVTLFDIQYPAGTRVYDQIRGEQYSILPDGSPGAVIRSR